MSKHRPYTSRRRVERPIASHLSQHQPLAGADADLEKQLRESLDIINQLMTTSSQTHVVDSIRETLRVRRFR